MSGMDPAQLLGDLGARLAGEEEVDERDVRLQCGRPRRSASFPLRRRRAALDPALALEQQAEAPVDDVMVVDDEDARRVRRHRHRPRAGIRGEGASARRRAARTRLPPRAAGPRSRRGAGRGRRPRALRRARRSRSRRRVRRSLSPTSTAISRGSACFAALRSASARTVWASGSRRRWHAHRALPADAARGGPRPASRRRMRLSVSLVSRSDGIKPRSSAPRSSPRTDWSSASARARSSAASSPSAPRTRDSAKRRWITCSWSSRVSAMRSSRRWARSRSRAAPSMPATSAAARPERAKREALALLQLERLAVLVGEDDAQPAPARGDRDAGDRLGRRRARGSAAGRARRCRREDDHVVVRQRPLRDRRLVQVADQVPEDLLPTLCEPTARTARYASS